MTSKPKGINTRKNSLDEIDRHLDENKGPKPSSEETTTKNPLLPIPDDPAAPCSSKKVQKPQLFDAESSSEGECSSSSSSESSSSDSDSDTDQDQEEQIEKGLIAKKYKSISINDRHLLKDLPNLISRLASLPNDITVQGSSCFQKFGSDLRDAKANVREIYKNMAKISNKEKRKQEKSEIKLIRKSLESIIEELLECRTGMFGPSLVSLAKESSFRKAFGTRIQQKTVQQLKMQLQSHKTICQSSLRSISSWKKPAYKDLKRSSNNNNYQRSQPKRANPWTNKDAWKNKKDKRD